MSLYYLFGKKFQIKIFIKPTHVSKVIEINYSWMIIRYRDKNEAGMNFDNMLSPLRTPDSLSSGDVTLSPESPKRETGLKLNLSPTSTN